MQHLTTIYAALFGLCFGSFANVVIYRTPRGESIVKPPSHCPGCGKRLVTGDLIPVVSWIALRGKCRYCRERISVRYPAVELICAVLFAGIAVHTGPQFTVIPLCLLAFTLLCVAFIDIGTQEIPDGLIIFGTVVGILWIAASHFTAIGAPVWYDALLGAACGALPLLIIDRLTLLIAKKDGFGYGDVKLMGMAGMFLGWQLTLAALFFAVVAGGVYGTFLVITRRVEHGSYLAFGPFLSAGVIAALWFGEWFLSYFS